MAARKKKPETVSLFGATAPIETAPVGGERLVMPPPAPAEESKEEVERPKLRVVPPPATVPESEVIVEPLGDGRFVVSLLRHHGTTVAAVRYTRAQLEMLLRRIPAALEVG
jgi:hypothetical protein